MSCPSHLLCGTAAVSPSSSSALGAVGHGMRCTADGSRVENKMCVLRGLTLSRGKVRMYRSNLDKLLRTRGGLRLYGQHLPTQDDTLERLVLRPDLARSASQLLVRLTQSYKELQPEFFGLSRVLDGTGMSGYVGTRTYGPRSPLT